MDPVLVTLAFHCVTEVDWFSLGVWMIFYVRCFQGNCARFLEESFAPLKHQKVDDDPVVSVLAGDIDVNWLSGVIRKTVSNVEYQYQRHCWMLNYDERQTADASADFVGDLDDLFEQEAHSEIGAGSFFIAGDRLVIVTALEGKSKTVPTSDYEFFDLL